MKTRLYIKVLTITVLTLMSSFKLSGEESSSIGIIFEGGKVNIDSRTRWEQSESGDSDPDGISIRTRLGYTTPNYQGFKGMLEMENVSIPFNADQPNGLDVKTTELNQLWLSYNITDLGSLKLGRQIYTLDDHRFIGHVGWRQNIQTFDAVTAKIGIDERLTLRTGFIDQVNRINATVQDMNGSLINLQFSPADYLQLTAFAYFLNFDSFAVDSDSIGVRATGKLPLGGSSLSYAASYSKQDQPTRDKKYDYFSIDLKANVKPFNLNIGYETLEGDASNSFSTPLATVHKFQGFADKFAGSSINGTQVNGITDLYFGGSYKFPIGNGVVAKAFYHIFEAETGNVEYGKELDIVLAYKINTHLNTVFKFADYNGEVSTDDLQRISFEVNFKY